MILPYINPKTKKKTIRRQNPFSFTALKIMGFGKC